MKTLTERCTELCKNKHGDTLRYNGDPDISNIAEKLARLLLDANAVNTKWRVESYSGSDEGNEGIVNFLQYMDNDLRGQLLAKGLDLNQELSDSGVVPFTWFIGNAQNALVDQLLTSAEQNQTLDQRLIWINKIDSMKRDGNLTVVGQTPLQLAIAKGYKDKSNDGKNDLDVSDLQIAEKLLRLGANQQINYQEPTRGNTALHIAYAKRDYEAIQLLEKHGACPYIRNKYGQSPADMLQLSFSQVEKLMVFHTSPDGHINTFRLNQEEFNDPNNLQKINNAIKLERQYIEVNGKELKIPENTFSFGPIQSAAIQNSVLNPKELGIAIENEKQVLLNAIQALHNYGEILKQKGQSKGQVAIELSIQLKKLTTEFYAINDWNDFPTFKMTFMTRLNSKNKEMETYRIAWPTIIKNVAIALTGLGLLLISAKLIYSKINEGRALFLFQNPKTTSEEKIDSIKQSIDKIKPH
ncbi:MAG: ankyrin repeat domain-containing protein [Legionellaceae bacterium]|nr:ankyrin repeat domain-containing protein [Legionellaceae bacterium]